MNQERVRLPQVYYTSLPLAVVSGKKCKCFSCDFCFSGHLKQNPRFRPLLECTAVNCWNPQHHASIHRDENSNKTKQTASRSPCRSRQKTIYNYLQLRSDIYKFKHVLAPPKRKITVKLRLTRGCNMSSQLRKCCVAK